MGEHGIRYTEKELPSVLDYVSYMIANDRVIEIESERGIEAVIFLSVCDDFDTFYKKPTWIYKPHDPHGKIVYVEKMVATEWNRELRSQFKDFLVNRYPNADRAIWHRWAKWGDIKAITFKGRIKQNV